jgi:aurora kinase
MAEVSHLEAAFERITVNDENDEQAVTTATYHKAKVDSAPTAAPSCV